MVCEFEKIYGLIVVFFIWFVNGGGFVFGIVVYLSDKDDVCVLLMVLYCVV